MEGGMRLQVAVREGNYQESYHTGPGHRQHRTVQLVATSIRLALTGICRVRVIILQEFPTQVQPRIHFTSQCPTQLPCMSLFTIANAYIDVFLAILSPTLHLGV
jgi:hypothetical protein